MVASGAKARTRKIAWLRVRTSGSGRRVRKEEERSLLKIPNSSATYNRGTTEEIEASEDS
jgi:hypothetical protein